MGAENKDENVDATAAAAATAKDADTTAVATATDDAAASAAVAAAAAAVDDSGKDSGKDDKSTAQSDEKAAKVEKTEKAEVKTVDLVKARREHQQKVKEATAAATAAAADAKDKRTEAQKGEQGRAQESITDGKFGTEAGSKKEAASGADKSGLAEQDDKEDAGHIDVSKIEYKAGWFDRLTKEQQAWLSKERPDIVAPINAARTEGRRLIETAQRKAEKIAGRDDTANGQNKTASATKTATTTATTKSGSSAKAATDSNSDSSADTHTAPDLSRAVDLLYDEDQKNAAKGLEVLFTHPAAQPIISRMVEEGVKQTLKSIGVDVDEHVASQPLASAIVMAAEKYPQLADRDDPSFFDEVDELLKEDEETYEALMGETNPRLIAAAIREASATVVRSRAAKKAAADTAAAATATAAAAKAEDDKKKKMGSNLDAAGAGTIRREALARNTRAAAEAAGVKASGGKRPGAGAGGNGADGSGGEGGKTVDLVRSISKQKDYQFIGRSTT